MEKLAINGGTPVRTAEFPSNFLGGSMVDATAAMRMRLDGQRKVTLSTPSTGTVRGRQSGVCPNHRPPESRRGTAKKTGRTTGEGVLLRKEEPGSFRVRPVLSCFSDIVFYDNIVSTKVHCRQSEKKGIPQRDMPFFSMPVSEGGATLSGKRLDAED